VCRNEKPNEVIATFASKITRMKICLKTYLTIIFLSVICISCSDSSTNSAGGSSEPISLDHVTQFQLNGGGFDHVLMDADSLGYFGIESTIDMEEQQTIFKVRFADSNWSGGAEDGASLTLHWKKVESGTTPWSNLWADSNAFGCKIVLSSGGPHQFLIFKSVSGQTNLKVFKTGTRIDSLFGGFSGIMKDASGNTISVSNGKFYMVF
jgi:hypothetical protein